MSRHRGAAAAVLIVAALLVTSAVALPLLSGVAPFEGGESDPGEGDGETIDIATADSTAASQSDGSGNAESTAADATNREPVRASRPAADSNGELVSFESATPTADADATASLAQEQTDAVEAGVAEGIELAQQQGVEVTQEQRAAAVEGARQSVVQHQNAEVEQIQAATAGAVHGSLIQSQDAEIEQIQSAVGGATDGALAQYQTVSASQMQSATWGATHGALAQKQHADVEQIQVATRGAAAGACREAGDSDVRDHPKIQEAAQGSAYGVLEQYQKITVEQRQRVTLEHVQHSAAGASAGALEGSAAATLEGEQSQRIDVEQRQRVNIKQVQKAATGAAKGALVQRQEVTVEQTQSAARGAGRGALTQIQTVSVEQVQRISITQIQEASFGAAKGSIYQSQSATVEQIQAAADGAAGGVLVQHQEISITQIQYAAVGASQGAIESAVQYQNIEIEQIQAAAFGAGEGAVLQRQVVDVTQVQRLASGGASGALIQSQSATVEQIQIAASSACQETARVVQYQRISVTQLQILTQKTASDATQYAVQQETADASEISQFAENDVDERADELDELEGTATISAADQESDGETVSVDNVDLSEGGFVAIYEGDAVADPGAVIGTSSALEAGSHSDVEIDLEDPIEEDQPLVAVVHYDTNDDGTFDYADSDGTEDVPYVTGAGAPVLDTAFVSVGDEPQEPQEPNATLSVSDQTGDGENLTVDEANATVDYTVTASANGSAAESRSFEANETATDLELEFDAPLEESTTVDVAVTDENGTELATDSIEYTVEDDAPAEPGEPNESAAALNVSDQTGDGETLTVEDANATVDYRLTVTDENGTQRGESDLFEANETAEFESVDLEPPLSENATLEVAVADEAGDELATETIEYTVDGDPATFDATFPGCSRAEVTGSFEEGDTIIVGTAFYEGGGFGNSMGEYAITVGEDVEAPFEGTLSYETGDDFTVAETADGATVTVPEGDTGAVITGFASPDATAGSIDHPNPNASECIEQIRPERPDIGVAETTPTEDGIAVTFEYENPNDAALQVGSEFVEGTTADAPPSELEPGNGTFTVNWTPESDDERLVWEVDMSNYDYEEPLTAETPPAGEIDSSEPTEPASFNVSITEATDSVEAGETLEVDAAIENTGGENGTQDVQLAIGDAVVNETPVSLESGASDEVTLTADTTDLEPGEYPVTVSSENETAETTVTVTEPGVPEFAVSLTGTNAPVEQGEPLEVDAEVENVGTEAGTQDVELAIGGSVVDTSALSLEAGASESVALAAETADLEPGEYSVSVSTENETVETTVTIEEPGEAEFAVADLEAPASGEPGSSVTVDATIENVGDAEGTQTVSYVVDGRTVAEESVALEAGGAATLSFSSTLPETDSTHTVATDDEQASVTIAATQPAEEEPTETGPTDEGPPEPSEQPAEPSEEDAAPPAEPPTDAPSEEPAAPSGEEAPEPESPETPEPEPPAEPGTPEPTTEPPAPESPGEPEGPAGTETGPATNGSDAAAE